MGHLRRYSRRSLLDLVRDAGVTEVAVGYWGLTMIPVLLLRKAVLRLLAHRSAAEKVRAGFQPGNEVVHALLRLVMRIELALLPSPWLGTSLVLVGRRRDGPGPV